MSRPNQLLTALSLLSTLARAIHIRSLPMDRAADMG